MKDIKLESQFVICVKNEGFPASLDRRKIYRVIPDADASRRQLLRVIDESGEDYLYPKEFFVPIKLPQVARKALALAQ